MSKRRFIIDFDNTLAPSAEYAIKYIRQTDPKYFGKSWLYDSTKLEWNFAPFIEKCDEEKALNYMYSQEFFDNLPCPDLEYIKKVFCLIKTFTEPEIVLCTNRPGKSFDMVKEWIKKFGLDEFFSDYICLSTFDKSKIEGCVIIDDTYSCIEQGDRKYRILFGDHKYVVDSVIDNLPIIQSFGWDNFAYLKDWKSVYEYLNNDSVMTGIMRWKHN